MVGDALVKMSLFTKTTELIAFILFCVLLLSFLFVCSLTIVNIYYCYIRVVFNFPPSIYNHRISIGTGGTIGLIGILRPHYNQLLYTSGIVGIDW
jgi:hypothetical protein